MKNLFHIILLILVFSPSVVQGQSEVLDPKKTWDLIRDIKDYKAGRLKKWTSVEDNILIPKEMSATYVNIVQDAGLPDTTLDFGVAFPMSKPKKVKGVNKEIEMVLVEIDFIWAIPKGYMRFTFERNRYQDNLGDFGVWLDGKSRQICVGSFSSPTFSSISISQTKADTLKIAYKPKDKSIFVSFGKKTFVAAGSFQPQLFSISGDSFDLFQITRFQMMVVLEE